MNIIMHLLFSYNMRRIIRKHSGVKLNLLGFMYGNILPDIKAIYKPHRISESLPFVVKRAKDLMKEPYQTGSGYSWSRKLGIIPITCPIIFAMPIRTITTRVSAGTCFTKCA